MDILTLSFDFAGTDSENATGHMQLLSGTPLLSETANCLRLFTIPEQNYLASNCSFLSLYIFFIPSFFWVIEFLSFNTFFLFF